MGLMVAATYPRVVIRREEPRTCRTATGVIYTHPLEARWCVTFYRRPGERAPFVRRVYVKTRASAERCRARFLAGEDITLKDMQLPDLRLVRGGA